MPNFHYDRLYIGGSWVAPTANERIDSVNATTEEIVGSVPRGTASDIESAVMAAVAARDGWARTPVTERAALVESIGAAMHKDAAELTDLFVDEVGAVRQLAANFVQAGCDMYQWNADYAREYSWRENLGAGVELTYEPVGVVAAITPWNYPITMIGSKVAPALAAGCPVVLKPSEFAPLTAFRVAEVIHQLGLPPGVFNLVSGDGAATGAPLVAHPLVDMIHFTGSTATGKGIATAAAGRMARVSLELGGKSACVVLDDGDLAAAVETSMHSITRVTGQGCAALSRLIVPAGRVAEAAGLAAAYLAKAVVGDPANPATTIGPLATSAQRARVLDHMRQAISDGAQVITGGPTAISERPTGFFVRPTVFTVGDPAMAIANEEVFGPVEVIIGHQGDDDAVRIANATRYGLAGAVFSADAARAQRVAAALRVGKVDINGYVWNWAAPFGGMKESGVGRSFGRSGFAEFLEAKTVSRS
jgi:betaine-aldehyde dehydrogenase